MAHIVRVYLPDLDYSFKTLEITSNTKAEDVMNEVIQKLVTNETILPVDPSQFILYYLLGEQKKQEIKKGERMLGFVKKWGKKDDCKLIMKAVDNIKLYSTALYEVNKRKEDSFPVTPTTLLSQDTHITSNPVTTITTTNTNTNTNVIISTTNNNNINDSNNVNSNSNNSNNIDSIDNNNSLSKSLNTNTNSTAPTQQLTHSDPTPIPTHTPSNTNSNNNNNNNITIASPILIDDEELVQLETLDLPPPILRISKPERGSMSTSQISEQKARNVLNDLERAYNAHSLSTAQDLLNFLTTQGV